MLISFSLHIFMFYYIYIVRFYNHYKEYCLSFKPYLSSSSPLTVYLILTHPYVNVSLVIIALKLHL